jgi:hypothetical protein
MIGLFISVYGIRFSKKSWIIGFDEWLGKSGRIVSHSFYLQKPRGVPQSFPLRRLSWRSAVL